MDMSTRTFILCSYKDAEFKYSQIIHPLDSKAYKKYAQLGLLIKILKK